MMLENLNIDHSKRRSCDVVVRARHVVMFKILLVIAHNHTAYKGSNTRQEYDIGNGVCDVTIIARSV